MKFSITNKGEITISLLNEKVMSTCEHSQLLVDKKVFTAKSGDVYLNHRDGVIGILVGNSDVKTLEEIKINAKKAGNILMKLETKSVRVKLFADDVFTKKEIALAFFEGLLEATYKFDNYKSKKTPITLEEINFDPEHTGDLKIDDLEEFYNKWLGITFARDLVNTPANDMYPETLSKEVQKLAECGVTVKVLSKNEIEKVGLKGFLSVARGSSKEPKFIIMEWLKGNNENIVLVGKGLTYDSGGYSIKGNDGMKTMKADMGGSASVIGAMKAIALNNLDVNVVGIVATCENMISGDAYKPGDIIPSYRGLNIEVDNTDAEGRITLADALAYSEDLYSPKIILDIATLTGACVVSLGNERCGLLGNSEKTDEIYQISEKEGEKSWILPSTEDFKKLNKSNIADIKNSGGRYGGASSAGLFVGAFLNPEKSTKWIHVDIAGPAYHSTEVSHYPAGATGFYVKTLYEFVKANK